jgi:hypothetical protein
MPALRPGELNHSDMFDSQGSSRRTICHVLTLALALVPDTAAQRANTFQYVGLSGVSAQQLFLGRPGKVYVVDKTGEPCPLWQLSMY